MKRMVMLCSHAPCLNAVIGLAANENAVTAYEILFVIQNAVTDLCTSGIWIRIWMEKGEERCYINLTSLKFIAWHNVYLFPSKYIYFKFNIL